MKVCVCVYVPLSLNPLCLPVVGQFVHFPPGQLLVLECQYDEQQSSAQHQQQSQHHAIDDP